ncbi:MAG: hypothetical protein JW742_01730 [Candidatus Aminicenantes bacterium]|nr:hypothetical protein [Candidatus Aminicenantes bacterium]
MSGQSGRCQPVMNARLFAALCETPLWRPLHTLIVSGRSWGDEIRRPFFYDADGLDALPGRAGFEAAEAELRRLSLVFKAKKRG